MPTLTEKHRRLELILRRLGRVMVAFSGGVDSTFLLAAASSVLGTEHAVAATARSVVVPADELRRARAAARALGVRHVVLDIPVLDIPGVARNREDRCFHCKNAILAALTREARTQGLVLCEGSNLSDRGDFRPGRRAVERWNARSPLLEAGLAKEDIRRLSRRMGLETWDLPAQACLATRFPCGIAIDRRRLAKIAKAESFLKEEGFPLVRVRHHGDIARIETDRRLVPRLLAGETSARIAARLKKLGWRYVSVDLEGYRTGNMNPPGARSRRKS